jgi:hypothetical protein
MVISDLHIMGRVVNPFETNSPLIIDANAMLSFPVVAQLFQSIARWNTKVIQRVSDRYHPKTPMRNSGDRREFPRCLSIPNFFGFTALETSDHSPVRYWERSVLHYAQQVTFGGG